MPPRRRGGHARWNAPLPKASTSSAAASAVPTETWTPFTSFPVLCDEAGDKRSCLVCAEPLRVLAGGRCNHWDVCAVCLLRLRLLYNDRRCPFCKTECDTVIISDQSVGDFAARMQRRGDMLLVPGAQAYCTSERVHDSVGALERFRSPYADPQSGAHREFRDTGSAASYMRTRFQRFHCDVCTAKKWRFPCEYELFSQEELLLHKAERGGPERQGHPLCEFCGTRFYGKDDLFDHMREVHFYCNVCEYHGTPNQWFADATNFIRHCRQFSHEFCSTDACAKQPRAFLNSIDLCAHEAESHNKGARNKRGVKVDLAFGQSSVAATGDEFDASGAPARGNRRGGRRGGRGRGGESLRREPVQTSKNAARADSCTSRADVSTAPRTRSEPVTSEDGRTTGPLQPKQKHQTSAGELRKSSTRASSTPGTDGNSSSHSDPRMHVPGERTHEMANMRENVRGQSAPSRGNDNRPAQPGTDRSEPAARAPPPGFSGSKGPQAPLAPDLRRAGADAEPVGRAAPSTRPPGFAAVLPQQSNGAPPGFTRAVPGFAGTVPNDGMLQGHDVGIGRGAMTARDAEGPSELADAVGQRLDVADTDPAAFPPVSVAPTAASIAKATAAADAEASPIGRWLLPSAKARAAEERMFAHLANRSDVEEYGRALQKFFADGGSAEALVHRTEELFGEFFAADYLADLVSLARPDLRARAAELESFLSSRAMGSMPVAAGTYAGAAGRGTSAPMWSSSSWSSRPSGASVDAAGATYGGLRSAVATSVSYANSAAASSGALSLAGGAWGRSAPATSESGTGGKRKGGKKILFSVGMGRTY